MCDNDNLSIDCEKNATELLYATDGYRRYWREPDNGIWEMRGPKRHFTHSKVMAWVAFDRMVKAVERFGLAGPVERSRALRSTIHEEVCRSGFDAERNTFVQSYGGKGLDASLLMIPLVGFLPAGDPRVRDTVEAIERDLMADGFVLRYRTTQDVDALPSGEAAFLVCSFWLADNLALLGRQEDARRLFEGLVRLCNDVGLLSEGYDPGNKRLLGNFPQALSHWRWSTSHATFPVTTDPPPIARVAEGKTHSEE